jgi:hypothetical protein
MEFFQDEDEVINLLEVPIMYILHFFDPQAA